MSNDNTSGTLETVKTHGALHVDGAPLGFLLYAGLVILIVGVVTLVLAARKHSQASQFEVKK